MKLLTILISAIFVLNVNAKNILLTDANSVAINQPITSVFLAKKTVEILGKAAKLKPGSDFYLVLNTPGGEVFAGMAFVDVLKGLHINVHTITLFAASMGYQFAQHLGKRYIVSSGILMSHRAAAGGLGGQINGELNARVKMLTDVSNKIDEATSKRVGLSLKQYQDLIVNELWLTSDQAVATNHADEVVSATCDSELSKKTYIEEINTMFGQLELTFSSCPLITAPIKVNVANIHDKTSKEKAVKRIQTFYGNMPSFVREKL